tara:strand:- start:1393 stop:2115 length:723 start_codon:yes stop_codon:yes gene_type:complete
MRAIILAAGRGSRMKNLTDTKPKCLLIYQKKHIIDWQIKAIKKNKIKDICIITGFKKELLKNYKFKKIFNRRWKKTNMVYSLICAKKWFKNKTFLVSYSDIYYDEKTLKLLSKSKDDISITYDPNWYKLWKRRFKKPLSDAETFKIDKDSNLLEIGKKTKNIKNIEGQYMGLLKFTPKGWVAAIKVYNSLKKEKKENIHMTSLLQLILKRNDVKIKAIPIKKRWFEFDNPKDLNVAKRWS